MFIYPSQTTREFIILGGFVGYKNQESGIILGAKKGF